MKAVFFALDEVPEKHVSLREVATKGSLGNGQGYLRCNCKTGCKLSTRCKCKKEGRLCSSKCHQRLSCANKS